MLELTFSHSTLSILDQNQFQVKVSSTANSRNYCNLQGFQKEKESLKRYIILIGPCYKLL